MKEVTENTRYKEKCKQMPQNFMSYSFGTEVDILPVCDQDKKT